MHLLPRRMGHFHDGPVISVTNCYRQKPLGMIHPERDPVVNMDIYIYMDYGNWMVMVDISDPEIDAIFSSRKQCQLRRSWNFDFSPPGRTAWIPSGEANNTKKSYILITKKPKGNAFTKLIYFMARIISNRMNDFKSSCKLRIRTMRDPMIAFQDFQGIIGCVGEALRVQVRHQAKT